MDHEEAAPLLLEHLEGRLDGPAREAVVRHAASCSECAALAETRGALVEAFRIEDAGGMSGHPGVDALVEAALRGDESTDFVRHLSLCASCAAEIEAVRGSHAEATRTRARSLYGPRALAAAAAAAVVLALSYPAYLGLWVLPEVRGRLSGAEALIGSEMARGEALARTLERSESERRSLGNWSGPITLPLLAAPIRGETPGDVTIELAEGQPFLVVAVDPGIPDRDPRLRSFFLEIATREGRPVWSHESDASSALQQLGEAGSLAFLVPSGLVPHGDYRLKVAQRGAGLERPLLDVPFTVARTD